MLKMQSYAVRRLLLLNKVSNASCLHNILFSNRVDFNSLHLQEPRIERSPKSESTRPILIYSHFQLRHHSSHIRNLEDIIQRCKSDIENTDESLLSPEQLLHHYDTNKQLLEIAADQSHVEAQYLLAKLMLTSMVKPIEALAKTPSSSSTNAKEVFQEIKSLQNSVIKTRQLKNKDKAKAKLNEANTSISLDDDNNLNSIAITNSNSVDNTTTSESVYYISSRTREAIIWLGKAANEKHGMSMCLLADTLLPLAKDHNDVEKVLSLYRKAVECSGTRNSNSSSNSSNIDSGSKIDSKIVALTRLGEIYFHGNEVGSVEPDLPKSFQYFLQAAQPQAQSDSIESSSTLSNYTDNTRYPHHSKSMPLNASLLLQPSHQELDQVDDTRNNSNGEAGGMNMMSRIIKDLEESEQRNYSNMSHDFDGDNERKIQTFLTSFSSSSPSSTLSSTSSSQSSSHLKMSVESSQACFWVGYCYATGENGCYEINSLLAVYYLSLAALFGHPKANYHLATIYRSGLKYCKTTDTVDTATADIKNNVINTTFSSTTSISNNNSNNNVNVKVDDIGISLSHHENEIEIVQDSRLFRYYLIKSIYDCDEDAIFCLADIKLNGYEHQSKLDEEVKDDDKNHDSQSQQQFFEKNVKQAMILFAKASSLGHIDAMLNLAAIHYHGVGGMAQDKQKAFEIYNIAAEKGSSDAWLNLASMYHLGDGIEKSEATAREIMRVIFGR